MTSRRAPSPEAVVPPGTMAELIGRLASVRPGEIDRAREMVHVQRLAPAEAVAAALLARTAEAVRLWRHP